MSNIAIPAGTCNLFPASPTNSVMYFSRLPQLSFVLQDVALPGVSGVPARIAAPGLAMRMSADHLTYDPLNVTFMVDEEFRTHRELHRWLTGVTGGEDRTVLTQRFVDEQAQYMWAEPGREFNRYASTNAGLTIVNGGKIPILRVLFYNVHLTAIGPVQFTTTTTDTNVPMTSTATFEYDWFSIYEIR